MSLQNEDAAGPWHARNSVVLLSWYPQLGGAAVPDDIDVEVPVAQEEMGAAVAEIRQQASSSLYATLEGTELLRKLKYEASLLLHAAADAIDPDLSLQSLGFDSLMLAQFSGILSHEFAFRIRDELLFSEATSINWLAQNAAFFRRGEEPPAPLVNPTETGLAGPSAAVVAPLAPASGTVPDVRPESMAPATGTRTPGRRKPGWFEQNCPCCTFCSSC